MTRRRAPHRRSRARIYVLAGVNGAGKSSLLGAMVREAGADYFNPDEAAQELLRLFPGRSPEWANGQAWRDGVSRLVRAIREGGTYGLETTLGARTIPTILHEALANGHVVRMLYVGLESAEAHIARVKTRVAAGGHDIPEAKIRQRYDSSRLNLIGLLPALTSLDLYDNSVNAPLGRGAPPVLRHIMRTERGVVRRVVARDRVPDWAKPIVAAALRREEASR